MDQLYSRKPSRSGDEEILLKYARNLFAQQNTPFVASAPPFLRATRASAVETARLIMTAQFKEESSSTLFLYPVLRVAFSLNLQAIRHHRHQSLTTVTSPYICIFPVTYVGASGTNTVMTEK